MYRVGFVWKFSSETRFIYFKIFLFTFLALFLRPSLLFAETVTYEEVVKLALEHSPRVKIKFYEINIAHAVYKQSFSNFYPKISIGSRVEKFENLTKTTGFKTAGGQVIGGQPNEWRTALYLTAEYHISNWYKRLFDTFYYNLLKEASFYDCQTEIKRLLKDINDLYSQVVEAKTKLKYSDLILGKLRKIYELKKLSYDKGELSYEELLKTSAEIESALKEQTNINRELNVYISNLSWLTGKKLSHEHNFVEMPVKGKISVIQLSDNIKNSPEYKAQIKQVEAFEKRLKAANVSFFPDIIFYARYDLYGNSFESLSNSLENIRKTAFTTGVFLTMPLFDGGRIKWEKMKALYELERQKERLRATEEEKGREIENLYLSYKEVQNNVNRYKNLLQHYKKIVQIAKKAYDLGERSMIELLEAEKDLLAIERDMKITENTSATLEKKIEIETEEVLEYARKHFGYDWACKY